MGEKTTFFLICISILVPRCTSADSATNEAALSSFMNLISSGREPEAVNILMTNNVVLSYHAPKNLLPFGGTFQSREAVLQFYSQLGQYITNHKYVYDQSSLVISNSSISGTFLETGESNGKLYSLNNLITFTFVDGLIQSQSIYLDSATAASVLNCESDKVLVCGIAGVVFGTGTAFVMLLVVFSLLIIIAILIVVMTQLGSRMNAVSKAATQTGQSLELLTST